MSLLLALGLVLVATAPGAAPDRDRDGLRDWFERRYGETSPNRVDSDHDGVVDSAEDSDGDRLSNLAEQRLRTHPGKKDSDGDGVLDWAEDQNRNGIRDHREQDRRPLPRGLTPTLKGSIRDVPARRAGCMTKRAGDRIRPCRYGARSSNRVVVIFGDSHAFHWVPALDRAGRANGWRIVVLAKGACRSASVNLGAPPKRPCARWRQKAIRWIQVNKPAAVLLSNAAPRDPGAVAKWRRALAFTLRAFPKRTRAAVLSDTPRPPRDVARCLKRHRNNMSACQFSRASARSWVAVEADKQAAEAYGALHASLFDKVCPYDPCPLVQGNKLVYRGVHHITATIARQLAPSMGQIVRQTLRLRR